MLLEATLEKKLTSLGCLAPVDENSGPYHHYKHLESFLAKSLGTTEAFEAIQAAFFALTPENKAPWGLGVGILYLTEKEVVYAAATQANDNLMELIAFEKEEISNVGVYYNEEQTALVAFDFEVEEELYQMNAIVGDMPPLFVKALVETWLDAS